MVFDMDDDGTVNVVVFVAAFFDLLLEDVVNGSSATNRMLPYVAS